MAFSVRFEPLALLTNLLYFLYRYTYAGTFCLSTLFVVVSARLRSRLLRFLRLRLCHL